MQDFVRDRLKRSFKKASADAAERVLRYPQFVYVFGCDGFVKIGIAANPKARLSACQTGNPRPVTFLGMFPSSDAVREERELHTVFSEFRGLGEWFKLPDHKLEKLLRQACYALD